MTSRSSTSDDTAKGVRTAGGPKRVGPPRLENLPFLVEPGQSGLYLFSHPIIKVQTTP